jgi:hypothetical protein
VTKEKIQWKNWENTIEQKERIGLGINTKQKDLGISTHLLENSNIKFLFFKSFVPYILLKPFSNSLPRNINKENNIILNHNKITLLKIQIQISTKFGDSTSNEH